MGIPVFVEPASNSSGEEFHISRQDEKFITIFAPANADKAASKWQAAEVTGTSGYPSRAEIVSIPAPYENVVSQVRQHISQNWEGYELMEREEEQ